MGDVARVSEGAPEVGANVTPAEATIRMGRLGLERRHRAPRSAAVGRHFRSASWNVSEKLWDRRDSNSGPTDPIGRGYHYPTVPHVERAPSGS